MPKTKWIEITYDDQTARVLPESVPAWEENGWTVVEDGSSESQPVEKAEPAKSQPQQRPEDNKE